MVTGMADFSFHQLLPLEGVLYSEMGLQVTDNLEALIAYQTLVLVVLEWVEGKHIIALVHDSIRLWFDK